jgi:hypothetical protein
MSAAVAVAVMCTSVRTPCAIEETTHARATIVSILGWLKTLQKNTRPAIMLKERE